jgi:hypothetical protein
MKKHFLKLVIAMMVFTTVMSGCMEQRYYREHHNHSPDYERRHHRGEHASVEVEIHH